MRKLIFILLLICSTYLSADSQKKPLVNNSYTTWDKLLRYNISNNGKFIYYEYGAEEKDRILVVISMDKKYKKEFTNVEDIHFTEDSKYLIFKTKSGVNLLLLGTEQLEELKNSVRYILPKKGNGEWMLYQQQGGGMVLKNLLSKNEKNLGILSQAHINPQSTDLVIEKDNYIYWIDLKTGTERKVNQSSYAGRINITFDQSGEQIAYTTGDQSDIHLYYYKKGFDSSTLKAHNKSDGIQNDFVLTSNPVDFSPNGKYIFFKLKRNFPTIRKDSIISTGVNIWSHNDTILQSQQLYDLQELKDRTYIAYMATNPIEKKEVYQLENSNTMLAGKPGNMYVLIKSRSNIPESFWNTSQIPIYEIFDLQSHNIKKFTQKKEGIISMSMSPEEKYVLWFNHITREYLCYDIKNDSIHLLARDIQTSLFSKGGNSIGIDQISQFKWLQDDRSIIMNDEYDLWQVDPLGIAKSVALTGEYGRKHQISLRVCNESSAILSNDSLLLIGLQKQTKKNGFFKAKINKQISVVSCGGLQEGLYYYPSIFVGHPPAPKKAANTDIYIVQYMTAKDAPNVYITQDFINFNKISTIHPEKGYNWMTTELLTWKVSDTILGKGILYKPEDFDSTQKYPVIFNYYQNRSNELYRFLNPELSVGTLSIPWYVSNGYLVFVPDIPIQVGLNKDLTVSTVVTAAKFLSSYSWVNSLRLGLQGHSYGGYETNLIIAHSNIFAAAQESAGASDLISLYGDLSFGEQSNAGICEIGQVNIGTTPWDNPQKFIDNSPIFFADKIKSPLLIMHNVKDGAVPVLQGIELFTALRRLKKKVWLLQYDDDYHTLCFPQNQLDFTIRQQQFFAHFLKDADSPDWMANGIQALQKGILSGLNLKLHP